MDFRQKKRRTADQLNATSHHDDVKGYHSFYKKPPSGSITLQQFEKYAVERLKVLKAVELASVLKSKKSEEYSSQMRDQFKELGWQFLYAPRLGVEDEQRDMVSHHILRLAYAKSEGKRQWFVTQEAELLRLRMLYNKELMNRILEVNDLRSNKVPAEEVDQLADELRGCHTGLLTNSVYYKVDFEEVLQLVSIRKVYLSQGYAYLPATELQSYVLNKYRIHLKEQLAIACKMLPGLEEENRVMKQLQALSGADLGTGYSTRGSGEKITAAMLDSLSLHSYPLCMQMIHSHIKTKHHSKHTGRMQYGLFLKGIGVSLEESLRFWRTEFCKSGMDTDKFDKNYAYAVRHNYGKEGKRTDYTPFSCMKIIGRSEPQGEECHGCPYKHNDDFSLRQMLEKKKISVEAMEEILSLKKKGHFQIACMSMFKASHPKEGLQGGLQHPNQYFTESQAILNGDSDTTTDNKTKQERGADSVKPEPAVSDQQLKSGQNKENIGELATEFDEEM